MKTYFLAFIAIFTLLTSCSEDNDTQMIIPTPTPAGTGFSWRENDPEGAVNTAPTATFSTQYKTLIVKDAAGATLFEVNLSGTAAATYAIGTDNAVSYLGTNPMFVADSGEVIVTANADGKISGTFKAFRSGTGVTRIYATFTDIPVVP